MIGQPASLEGARVVSGVFDGPGIHVRGPIPDAAQAAGLAAFSDLPELLPPSLTRRSAAGMPDLGRIRRRFPRAVALESVSPTSCRVVRDDGHTLRQVVSNPVQSYVAGWRWDRFRAEPAPGIVSKRLPDRMGLALPLFHAVDNLYRGWFPDEHARQRAAATRTIGLSAFTTAAINIDYASHYHRDTGDLPGVFSTVVALGDFDGGELVFPEHRLAVDLRPGFVCFFRAYEQIHGNTPVRRGRRVSVVSYARAQLCRVQP